MDLNIVKDSDNIIVEVKGKIRPKDSKELGESLDELISEKPKKISIDLSGMISISSAALRILVNIKKKAQKEDVEFFIENIEPNIKEVFDITGFSAALGV